MKCANCQTEIPEKFKFCPECGSNVSALSSVSGVEQDAGASLGALRTMNGASGNSDSEGNSVGDLRTMQTGRRLPGESTELNGSPLSDRYELGEELGHGGFARVWKARDRKLDRTVAVKRLLDSALEGSAGRQTLERFDREATAIAQLNHRNIVMVYDHDADAEGHYIVMECVEGGTLRDYLKNQGGKLPVAEAVVIVKGIAQGLGYAHRKNLVHRDIKPANILLETSDVASSASSASPRANVPNPKIVDFGLARMGSESELSMSGYGMGTPWYMPPEQRRNAKGVNHTADIYALGKVLYELVSGDVPDNVDPDKIPEKCLLPVILKCIKTNPEERYFSCEDFLRDLEAPIAAPESQGPETSSASNVCPSCGNSNPDEVKFCEACGTGLYINCPECDRENSVRKKFCGACGTEVVMFSQIQSALPVIQRYRDAKNWSRLQKECDLLPKEPRLPGVKGRNLAEAATKLRQEAIDKLAAISKLAIDYQQQMSQGKLDEAQKSLKMCRDLDPARSGLDALEKEVVQKIEERDHADAFQALVGYEKNGNYDGGSAKCDDYLRLHPGGKYQSEVLSIKDKFEIIGTLCRQFDAHLWAAEFDQAGETLNEMEASDVVQYLLTEKRKILARNRSDYELFERSCVSHEKDRDLDKWASVLISAEKKWPKSAIIRDNKDMVEKKRNGVAELINEATAAINAREWAIAKDKLDLAIYIWPKCSKAAILFDHIDQNKHGDKIAVVVVVFVIIVFIVAAILGH